METLLRITLRLPTELHAALDARARAENRSLNGQIIYLLRKALGI